MPWLSHPPWSTEQSAARKRSKLRHHASLRGKGFVKVKAWCIKTSETPPVPGTPSLSDMLLTPRS